MSEPLVPDVTVAPPPQPDGPSGAADVATPGTSAGAIVGSRSLRLLLALAAAIVVIAGLKAFSGSLGPAFLALVLVIVVHPLGVRLQRWGLPSAVGVAVNLVVVYLIVGALAASLAWAVVALATTLPDYLPQLVELRSSTLQLLTQVGVDQTQLIQMINSADPYQLLGYAQTLVGQLTSGLTDFTFVLLLLFFLAVDAAPFPALLAQAESTHADAVEALRTFAFGTRRYLVVSTVFGAIVAVMDVVALVWLGVPLALLWGLVSFVTNYVANIGFLLGLVPPALLALLANGPENALWVVVVYTVINVVVQGLIQPKIVGDAVGLSVSLTFLSVVFWGFVLGGLGALLAVPLSLLARAVLVDADPRARWLLPLVAGSTRGVPVRKHRHRQRVPLRLPHLPGQGPQTDAADADDAAGSPPGTAPAPTAAPAPAATPPATPTAPPAAPPVTAAPAAAASRDDDGPAPGRPRSLRGRTAAAVQGLRRRPRTDSEAAPPS